MAILFVGFFKQVVAMMFGETPGEIEVGEGSIWLLAPPGLLIVVVLCFSFYVPSGIRSLIATVASQY
jgi:hypothetical protein